MSDKIYLVKAVECGVPADDEFDCIVGYASSLEDAKAACKKLKSENESALKFWREYGQDCYVECEVWPTADNPNAIAALKKERKRNKCPYANLDLKELFYGKEAATGGFEIICENKCDKCYCPSEYDYLIEEVERLK